LNAANEVAVGRFLAADSAAPLTVGDIYRTVEETLRRVGPLPADTLAQVLTADRIARESAAGLLP
jgi:1-deoxy-D-xylulose 5-phosphate reductoisomerase